jgi:hypothetical protein
VRVELMAAVGTVRERVDAQALQLQSLVRVRACLRRQRSDGGGQVTCATR